MDLSDQKTQVMLLIVLGVLGAVYAWFTYIYTPRNDRINELEGEKTTLEQDIATLEIEVAKLPRVERQLAEARERWSQVLLSFPTEPREEEVIANITNSEQISGLYVVGFTTGARRMRPLYIEQDYTVNMLGHYQELARFIASIASHRRRMSVEKIRLQHPSAVEGGTGAGIPGGAGGGPSAQADEVVIVCTVTTYIVRQGGQGGQ
jgi:Tfp pilus assembly protein PilO